MSKCIRLHRIAQNDCPCEKILWRFWMILVESSLVQVLLRRSCGGPCEMLSCMILYRPLWEDLDVKSSGCPCTTWTAQVLLRRFCGDLCKRPCKRSRRCSAWSCILQMPRLTAACMKALVGGSWEVLVSRSCKLRSSSSRPFYDDLVSLFFWDAHRKFLHEDFVSSSV